ncbi:MAG: methionyl-tRNA formyltransferase [Syntrophobacteraceae bacterium]
MEEAAQRGAFINPDFPRIIFMGTPDFAALSLRKLAEAGAPVVLVITQPDRPSGRGRKLASPPVKILARELNIPVFQPESMRKPEALDHIRSFDAECAAVVAYGRILPQNLLDAFKLGVLNVHASLLPRHRGAAPIQRSILAGDAETGVSVMLLDAGMDTGPVLSRSAIPILEEDTFLTLHDKLAVLGAEMLCRDLVEWRSGRISAQPQDETMVSLAPPISKEELRLAWDLPAQQIVNTIRAFDPSPGAYGFFEGKRIKCFRASMLHLEGVGRAGEVVGLTDKGVAIVGGDGKAFAVGDLQFEGQRRLAAVQFLSGHPLPPGSYLE